MNINCAPITFSVFFATAFCGTPAGAASGPNFRISGLPGHSTLAHWPDSILCRFPSMPYIDKLTGVPTGAGDSKPYSLIVRLTLAPAKDGLYYYGVGPIFNKDSDQVIKPNHDQGLNPGAILKFNPDGTPSSTGPAECAGKSIEQLTATGLTGR